MRKIVLAVAAALVVLSLSACASTTPVGSSTPLFDDIYRGAA